MGSWFLSSEWKIFWAWVSTLTSSQSFPLLATTVNIDTTDSMVFFYSNMSLSKLWEMVKDREARRAAAHGVAKSRTWLSDLTTSVNMVFGWRRLFHTKLTYTRNRYTKKKKKKILLFLLSNVVEAKKNLFCDSLLSSPSYFSLWVILCRSGSFAAGPSHWEMIFPFLPALQHLMFF